MNKGRIAAVVGCEANNSIEGFARGLDLPLPRAKSWSMRALLLACLLLAPLPARACAVALVLAMDVSGSVDSKEYALQMNGLSDALGDPLVSEALVSAKALVTLVQWSGRSRQQVSIPWTAIATRKDVIALRTRVVEVERAYRNYATAIGEVLDRAIDLLKAAPYRCDRRVIDVSGDGKSNEGKRPVHTRARLDLEGITVNGLAIRGSEPDIVPYFRERVIHGPNAFLEIADGYGDYPRAIRRKLISELAQRVADIPLEPTRAASVLRSTHTEGENPWQSAPATP